MKSNKIIHLPDPQRGNEPVTKQYGDRTYLTDAGFVMNDNIGMNNHMVTNLGTPTNNNDAATKKYVDDKRCTFKDGTTSISMVDLRDTGLNGAVELYNNITFDGGAYGQDLGPSSVGKSIINKNTLQTGQLITMQSLSPALSRMFQTAVKKELLVIKGKPTSNTVIYKDPFVSGNPTFTTDSSSVELTMSFTNDLPNGNYKYEFDLILASSETIKVFLYGECGGTGYKATTWYQHWNGTFHGHTKQDNANGGYFHLAYGTHIHFEGHFRNFGNNVVNFGKSYGMNESGAYNEFVVQKLTVNPSETKIFGLSMTWLFENNTAGRNVPVDASSYFYVEKVQSI